MHLVFFVSALSLGVCEASYRVTVMEVSTEVVRDL